MDGALSVRPDASRADVAKAFRGLAGLIEDSLPRRVTADDVFLPWNTTAALLLARIARQGQTLALLIEAQHELDAEMVMRSLLEHEILFAWLAITPQDSSRKWKARDPDQNTLWWMVEQFRREKKQTEDQEAAVGGVMDDQMRYALRTMKRRVNALPARGKFPSVLKRAQEVDAHWGPRLDGFAVGAPRTPAFLMTYTGHYWTLYSRGSSSVHPDWGAVRRFLRPPDASGYQRHYVESEQTDEAVNVYISIAAFLMGEALAVADAVLGWSAFDDALRLLDRWDEVRAPTLMVEGIREVLDGEGGRRYGRVGDQLLSVAISEAGDVAIVVVDERPGWTELSHRFGTREWTHRDERGTEVTPGAADGKVELGPVVMERVELLARAEWIGQRRPDEWPEGAP